MECRFCKLEAEPPRNIIACLPLARIRCATLGMHFLETVDLSTVTPGKILEFIKRTRLIMELNRGTIDLLGRFQFPITK